MHYAHVRKGWHAGQGKWVVIPARIFTNAVTVRCVRDYRGTRIHRAMGQWYCIFISAGMRAKPSLKGRHIFYNAHTGEYQLPTGSHISLVGRSLI